MKRKIQRSESDNINKVKRNPYKRNTILIEDEKEREYFKTHNCPKCESRQIYYRSITKDYKCKVCNFIFYFDGNMYIETTRLIRRDLHKIYMILNCLPNKKDDILKIHTKLAKMLLAGRGNIQWEKK